MWQYKWDSGCTKPIHSNWDNRGDDLMTVWMNFFRELNISNTNENQCMDRFPLFKREQVLLSKVCITCRGRGILSSEVKKRSFLIYRWIKHINENLLNFSITLRFLPWTLCLWLITDVLCIHSCAFVRRAQISQWSMARLK